MNVKLRIFKALLRENAINYAKSLNCSGLRGVYKMCKSLNY